MYSPIVLSVLLPLCGFLSGAKAAKDLRLLIIGDMGGIDYEPYSTYFERSTAQEMAKIADLYSPHAIFTLGDNFYYDGVKNVDDPRFKTTFESVYFKQSLQVPWYVVAGNHDHHGNVSAQIEYSKHSSRWNFPDYFYYREFKTRGTPSQTVGVVFIDTVVLCGNTDHDDDSGQPQLNEGDKNKDKYWEAVKGFLKNSKANYLFTAGHFPVYSVGSHGPTKCLLDKLQPLLEKYKANGHICGHDHNLQHLRVDTDKGQRLDYFVSGMANFVNPSAENRDKVPEGSLKFHNADYFTKGGFLYTETTDTNMTFTFMSANGDLLYSTVVKPRF